MFETRIFDKKSLKICEKRGDWTPWWRHFFAERPWASASEPGRMKLVSELKVQTLGFCSELLSILQQFKE